MIVLIILGDKMSKNNWADELPSAITISDADGNIVYMNNKSQKTFEKYGGANLIGTKLSQWHKAEANELIKQIAETGIPNAYTIEKAGIKKLIYQTPYYENGEYAGLVEFSMEIPFEMPNYIRS